MANQDSKSNSQIMREIYLESGLSYAKFAQAANVPYSTVAGWLTGRRNPPDYVIEGVVERIQLYKSRHRSAKGDKKKASYTKE